MLRCSEFDLQFSSNRPLNKSMAPNIAATGSLIDHHRHSRQEDDGHEDMKMMASRLSYQQEDKKQECLHKLDLFHYKLCQEFRDEFSFLSDLTDILDYAKDMIRWVHEYDYKPNIPANGYRSIIRLTINLMRCGLSFGGDKKLEEEYFKLVKMFKSAIILIQTLRRESLQQQKMDNSERPPLFSTPIDMNVDLMTKFTNNDQLLNLIFGPLENFDKRPIVKYLSKVANYAMSIKTAKSWGDVIQSLISFTPEAVTSLTARRYANHNVNQVASMLSQGRGFFYENVLNVVCNFGVYPNVIKTIHVPRQIKWTIEANINNQNIDIKYQNNSSLKGSVRCKVYQELPPKDDGSVQTPDGKMVIFTHGGGFITNSPESHEMWMLRFVKSLPRATFISIDFKVSPEGKFPEALQQILDVMLWTQSGNAESLRDALGFVPEAKNIIFCGDSSGALLITTALVAMAEINEKIDVMNSDANNVQNTDNETNAVDGDKINRLPLSRLTLPRSLITFYPTFSLTPRVFPSYFLGVFDPVLFPTIAVQMASAYLPPMSDKSGSVCWDAGKDDLPWFKYPVDQIRAVFDNNLSVFEHPLVSPLFYQKMDHLKDVHLFMIALHPDPLLDNAVAMASKWKGGVSLDVLDDMAHGFLNYIFFNFMKCYREKFNPAIDLCIHRMRQALYD